MEYRHNLVLTAFLLLGHNAGTAENYQCFSSGCGAGCILSHERSLKSPLFVGCHNRQYNLFHTRVPIRLRPLDEVAQR